MNETAEATVGTARRELSHAREATPGIRGASAQPETLPQLPQAGVCLHITSLPGPYGIGEIGDAAHAFIDSMQRMSLRVWQFLPTGPTASGDSPYLPMSSFAGNELLIDTAMLIRAGFLTATEADNLLRLPAATVDYGALTPVKNALLDRAAGRFAAQADADLKSNFDHFMERNDRQWLHDYALFRILKARHGGRPWPEWYPHFAHRETAALRKLEAQNAVQVERIKIIQFLFHRQWQQLKHYAAERGVLLFGDLPIYIALDSADAWANRDILCIDADGRPDQVAGVPPDYFSQDGQLWGNPLYDWKSHAASSYRWWIARLRQSTELADIVRIDHFRGFEAYWSVPSEAKTARIGEWLPGPGDAIFDAMRNALGHLPIVAEDLGVITPEVEALRDRHGIPGMKVLQFELGDENFDLNGIGENCVCYTGTHDNDTTVGWFHGSPSDNRSIAELERTRSVVLNITGGSPDTIHKDLIKLAFSSAARLAIAPMQDYLGLGSEARLNTPGTSGTNWRWRMQPGALAPALMEATARQVSDAGRDG